MSEERTGVETELDRDIGIVRIGHHVDGSTREGLLQQFVFGTIPEAVGREAAGTVIMAKRNLGVTSHLRRLFSRG